MAHTFYKQPDHPEIPENNQKFKHWDIFVRCNLINFLQMLVASLNNKKDNEARFIALQRTRWTVFVHL